MNCCIVTGGNIVEAFALPYLEEHSFDLLIGVDGGLDFLYSINRRPDWIIGDFDSVNPLALEYFRHMEGVECLQLSSVKDDTDTECAIRKAMELGASDITILGATGSRVDHLLGNICLLGLGFETGTNITMVDGHNRIQMVNAKLEIEKEKQYGRYVSLIPFTTTVEGVTCRGMKYPLENYIMGGFCSLGISNEIVDSKAVITVSKGVLIVVESKD